MAHTHEHTAAAATGTLRFALTIVATCLLATVAASAAPDQEFSVGSARSPLNHYWEAVVGSGHATLGLRADWQRQLAQAHKDLGFASVRFHGVLDDDMSTYTILEGKLGYSFVNVDAIYDFLVSQNMAPYVELSFMPEGLATGNATIMHYKGNITPPQTLQKWYDLIHTFVQHLVSRYGVAEVRTWRFECWNEPNGAFWTGTQAQYFALFNATAAAIKAVDSQLQIGGPATEQSGWVTDLLEYCQTHGVPVDFVSTHQYPTDPPYDGKVRDVMHEAVAKVQSQMAAAGAADVPLVYSEYNDGLWRGTPVGPLHDTTYASAFIAYAVPSVVPLNIAGMSWWTFSDIFEEQGQLPSEFSGMWGLQTVNGIPKPSYRAFELLHRLGDQAVPCTATSGGSGTVSCFAAVTTQSGVNHAQVLLSNYQVPQVPNTNKTVVVQVPGAGTATITRIDKAHANSYQAWLAMGSPTYPSPAQVASLVGASALVAEPIDASTQVTTPSFTIELEPSGVAFLDITMPMR